MTYFNGIIRRLIIIIRVVSMDIIDPETRQQLWEICMLLWQPYPIFEEGP